MVASSDAAEQLRSAWRALAGHSRGDGWATIPLNTAAPCQVLAGRRFPGSEETLLVGFRTPLPPAASLPEGRGFRVERPSETFDPGHHWLALSRQPSGNLDLFSAMATDLIELLASTRTADRDQLSQLFLVRIRAWQAFMEKDRAGNLSLEAEIGLYGELLVVRALLDAGIAASDAIEAWRGPLDCLHDFELGTGAIEVKSTLATSGFPATIWSIEQLDDTGRQPLFLAGIRLALDGAGRTLPELIAELRNLLRDQREALAMFENRLLQAGYLDPFAGHYLRRFTTVRMILLAIDARFPRFTRASVPAAITKLWYVVDLDLVPAAPTPLPDVLHRLGCT
jgi:hypothetical protein